MVSQLDVVPNDWQDLGIHPNERICHSWEKREEERADMTGRGRGEEREEEREGGGKEQKRQE